MVRVCGHAFRQLSRSRAFFAATTLILTIGIASTTTVFAIVNAALLRPLPYPHSEGLVSLSHTLVVGGTLRVEQSDATILFYQRHQQAFTGVGGYRAGAAALGPVGGDDAEHVVAGFVTADLLGVLQIVPLRGRLFSAADDRPGAPPVAIVGERLWKRKWGGDVGVLHRRVEIDGTPREIIGIVPASLAVPTFDTELWMPLRLDPARTESATFDFQAIGRLRSGTSLDAAAADLQRLLTQVPDEFPGRLTRTSIEQTHMRASVRPLAETIAGNAGAVLWFTLAAAALVLAIACANCANLFLVRVERRRDALVLERALGAGPRTIALDALAEGFVVSTISGMLALTAAPPLLQLIRSAGGSVDIPRLPELSVDAAVIVSAAITTLCAALCVGVFPAIRSVQASRSANFNLSTRAATPAGDRRRVRQFLVATQVALALVLLTGSGLMASSVWRLRAVSPGFEPRRALSFRIALPAASYPAADDAVRFVTRAEGAVQSVAGVSATGSASKLPLDDYGRVDTAVFVEDRPVPPGSLPGIHPISYVTPDYFDAAGIPLITGRTFTRADPPHVETEIVVSRSFAKRYWGEATAVGRRLRIFSGGPWYTVVGVVGSVHDTALDQAEDQTIYCPLLPAREDPRWAPRDVAMVVRTDGDPRGAETAIRSAIRRIDPSLAVYRTRPLTAIVERAAARRTFLFAATASASAVALLLGAAGLYAVMTFVVTLRRREMGIRLALGADPAGIRRMVTREAMTVAVCGILAGLAAAMALTRFLGALLYEVSPTDPSILAGAAVLLASIAAAASWLPARRAAAVDPAITLRAE